MEAPPETKLATPTPLPQQKQPDAPPIVGSTFESNGTAYHTRNDAPQHTSALTKFLEDDANERVIFSLDEFATFILDLPTDWKVKEEFSLPPTSTAVTEALGAYLKVAIKIVEGREEQLSRELDEEVFRVENPQLVLGSLLKRNPGLGGIYNQLLKLTENKKLSTYLAEKNIFEVFWLLLLLFAELKLKIGFAEPNIQTERLRPNSTVAPQALPSPSNLSLSGRQSHPKSNKRLRSNEELDSTIVRPNKKFKSRSTSRSESRAFRRSERGSKRKDVEIVKVKHPNPPPAVEIQSDASTPFPSTPSTPTATSFEGKDGPRVTIQCKNKTKTVRIATLQEARAEGMSRAEQNVIQAQGQHPTSRKCATEMISTKTMDVDFTFAHYRGSEVESEHNNEWKKLVLAMICQLKKLPTEKLVFVPTLVLNGFDYLRDPEQFLQEFTDDPQGLIDAVYCFKEVDGRTRQVIIKSILYHATDSVGLRSIIVDVECLCTKPGCEWHGNGRKIVKISYMSTTRTSEPRLIKEVRLKAESTSELWALNHLPNPIHSLTLLPNRRKASHRRLKKNLKEKYKERAMHVTVLEQLYPLSELEDPRDFAQVFYDILQIHQWLYDCGGILHGDLSLGNIMFRRKDGKIYGVLNDFDLSSRVEDVDNGDIRTGTRPFMSLDMLNSYWEWGHLYHHDLESLFYVMLCLACRYQKPGIPADEPRPYSEWYSGTDIQVYVEKRSFIFTVVKADFPVQPYFMGLRHWLSKIFWEPPLYYWLDGDEVEEIKNYDRGIMTSPTTREASGSFHRGIIGTHTKRT
ncbi:protein kinase [Lentinula edodes]|nr:protein kinase [Lentinula edodes]